MRIRLSFLNLVLLSLFVLFQYPVFAQGNRTENVSCDRLLKEADVQEKAGRHDKALDLFNRVIEDKMCAGVLCEAYSGRGRARSGLDDLNGAISDYERALRCRPASADFNEALGNMYLKRGNLRERLGDIKGAAGDYERALRRVPNLREAAAGLSGIQYRRGVESEKMGNFNRAAENYKAALKLDPSNREASEALNNLEEKKVFQSQQRDGLFTF